MDAPETQPEVIAHVALGSNLGDRRGHLASAVRMLNASPGVRVLRVSRLIETPALGPPQPDYLNGVVELATTLSPRALLELLLDVERHHGRRRESGRWTARTLDLDLLLYGDCVVNEPGLTVPHPELHRRAFVLAPLAELAPDRRHPVLGRTVSDLLSDLAPNGG